MLIFNESLLSNILDVYRIDNSCKFLNESEDKKDTKGLNFLNEKKQTN